MPTTQTQPLDIWDIPNNDIEKYIYQTHKEFPTDIIESARLCMAGTSPRAESEYKLCISRICEYYNNLLASVDFKLQVAYKIISTSKVVEESRTSSNREGDSGNYQQIRQNRIIKICKTGVIIGLGSAVTLLAIDQMSFVNLSLMTIVGVVGAAQLFGKSVWFSSKKKLGRPEFSSKYRQQNPDEFLKKYNNTKRQKLVGYAISLERLITRMYHATLRLFQTKYVFSHPKQELPNSFSMAPPPLNYIYQPLLTNQNVGGAFSF